MESNNDYVNLGELDYKYGIDTICSILDLKEERVIMLSADNYSNDEIAFELNLSVNEVLNYKESAINKIIDKFGRGE